MSASSHSLAVRCLKVCGCVWLRSLYCVRARVYVEEGNDDENFHDYVSQELGVSRMTWR